MPTCDSWTYETLISGKKGQRTPKSPAARPERWLWSFPPEFLQGKSFSYFAEKEVGRVLPRKVRWVDTDGNELVSILMTSERSFGKAGKDFTFPTRFIIRDTWSGMTIDIVIEELEIDGHIDPAVFKLDPSAVDLIWDHDLDTYVTTIPSRPEP